MRIQLPIPGFEGHELAVETAGFFGGAHVLLDGAILKKQGGRYRVKRNSGEELALKLEHNFLDPIPKVRVGDEVITLVRPLTWYEYLWLCVPILLVFAGGGLGALVGILATYTSARIFRSDRSTRAKYGLTALVSVAALAIFLILAVVVQVFFLGKKR